MQRKGRGIMETVEEVKGIGPKTVALLKKIDINTVEDLVTHYPFRYDILKRTDLKTVPDGEKVVIDGKVESVPILLRFRGGLNKLNFRLVSSSGVVGVSIFNRAFLKPSLLIGTNVIVLGKFERTKNVVTASDIKFGLLTNQEKIEPVYHSTTGLTSKNLSTYINQALMQYGSEVPDYIPTYICDKYHFSNKKTALNILHNPPSIEKLKEAQIRLKYEELFAFMFKINYLREQNHQEKAGLARDIQKDDVQKFIDTLPFSLTGDQLKTVWEVVDDLNASKRMNRIIQGDVGSGKTIVSIIAMYANYLSGYQSALMAPTEILAKQHYDNVCNILKDTGIRVVLLTGSMTKKEKQVIYDQLESGEVSIAVGTHALIQDDVHYQNLGLVITDEQHRFGVNQRANLKNKGLRPDVLYMSATPIPRTYALTLYGDMDVSIIKEMPKGRKPVKTYVKSESEIKDVLTMMLEELKKGHQLVHGKMGALQKETIMKEFQQNHIHILISTTVIEVGVDVPNATMMVIFDANRFGLSTLHQLRGRVGRGDAESTCVLISNSDTKRLQIMEETSDGFVIAEEDFKLRGHGDLFGTKQRGDMAFKIANVKSDYKILVQARDDSREYLLNKDFNTEPLKQKLLSEINDN